MGERQKKSENAFQKMGRYNDNKDGIVYAVWKKRLEKAVTDATGEKGPSGGELGQNSEFNNQNQCKLNGVEISW